MIRKKYIMEQWNNCLLFFLFSLFLPLNNYGQDKPVSYISYNFPGSSENVVNDSANTLAPFFEQLKQLEKNTDSLKVISIIHLGDSHIQADFQTAVTRQLLQRQFGNAGRGLIVPLKLAKTNEPKSYKITSLNKWEAIRCIKPGTLPVGIGGLTLINNDSVSLIEIETLDKYNPDKWSFNDITVFSDFSSSKVRFENINALEYSSDEGNIYTKHFKLDTLITQANMEFISENEKKNLLYGFNLKNSRSGVLYHAIGINGAHYENYADAELFSRQLAMLDPVLIIISLGTNEAYDPKFNQRTFYANIDKTINNIRTHIPEAIFILTTPAETWYRYRTKYRKPHPNIKRASEVIVQYAKDNQLSYWDLFSITGGKGSANSWRKHQLLSRDGIHFSKEGYEFIGEYFYEAINNSYQKYLE